MNTEHAISKFVAEKLSLFATNPFDVAAFKAARKHYFFDKYNNRFGTPSNRDVAHALVTLLSKRGLPEAEITSFIQNSEFMQQLGNTFTEELIVSIRANDRRPVLSKDQIVTIKSVGGFELLKKEKEKEIVSELTEKQQVLKQEVEQLELKKIQKQQEYDAVPSILEKEDIPEPEVRPEVEDTRQWWERFYLKANPFPRTDGLSKIPEEMYEQIISKTKPFIQALSSLQKDSDFLFHKGILLIGDYGYGKTTFVDYLSHYLIALDILPVRITCARAFSDSAAFADSFYQRLMMTLRDEASAMTTLRSDELAELQPEDTIVALAKRIVESRKKGIVIFLDDYHKHRTHFPQIYEFLGTLQVLKDSLTRAGVNAGFVVSGTPEWRIELSRNGQLHGFLDGTPVEIPPASADFVCEVFNKRIQAFCFESTPRLIRRDFVQKLVRDSGHPLGVRDYLNAIIAELSNNNHAIVDSPIVLDEDTLTNIRNNLEQQPVIKTGLNKLLYETKFKGVSDIQIARCLELLVQVGTHDGITENDRQFAENKYYFKILKECGLIQKQRSGTPGVAAWGLRDRLKEVVRQIQELHKLHLNDYLLKLYAFKDYSARKQTITSDLPTSLKGLKDVIVDVGTRLPTSVVDNLSRGVGLYERFGGGDAVKPSEVQLRWAEECLDAFSHALFELDTSSTYFKVAGVTNLAAKWRNHPCIDEPIREAIERLRRYSSGNSEYDRSLAVKQIANVIPDLADTIREIIEDQCLRVEFGFLKCPADHTEDEIAILTSVRDLSYSGKGKDHFVYVKKIVDYAEIRLRAFLYATGSLLFGSKYFDHLPAAVRHYAHKNLESRQQYSGSSNAFTGLTRSQYRQILCETNPYSEHIVRALDLKWKSADWTLFGDTFALENLKVAHLQEGAYSPAQRNQYLRFTIMLEELLASINRLVSRIIEQGMFVCAADGIPKSEECLYRASFKPVQFRPGEAMVGKVFKVWPEALQPKGVIVDHCLTQERFTHLSGMIHQKLAADPAEFLVIDLLNLEYTETHYRAIITDIVNTIAYMRFVSKEVCVHPWFGGSIVVRREKT